MKTLKIIGTLALSVLLLAGISGMAQAGDQSGSKAEAGRDRSVEIKRSGNLTRISGNLNLKALVEKLQTAEVARGVKNKSIARVK
jgi:hypothetical protein